MPESGHHTQVNPPTGLPDPALVAKEILPYERRVPNGIKPTFMHWNWKDYKGRYFTPDPTPTWTERLFGTTQERPTTHPCNHLTNVVHKCLEEHDNKMDFCRSTVNVMEGCFREYKWE